MSKDEKKDSRNGTSMHEWLINGGMEQVVAETDAACKTKANNKSDTPKYDVLEMEAGKGGFTEPDDDGIR